MKKILFSILFFAFATNVFAQRLDRAEIFEGAYFCYESTQARTDDSGNIYVFMEGFEYGPANISLDTNVYNIANSLGSPTSRLMKYNAQGGLQWIRTFSVYCTLDDWTLDHQGNVYFTGRIQPSGSVSIAGHTYNAGPNGTAFIIKQNASGSFAWADTLNSKGLGSYVEGWSVTTDDAGNVYVVFQFDDTFDFDFGAGVDTLVPYFAATGGSGSCVVKLDSGGHHIWAKNLQQITEPFNISLDKDRNIYLTGRFTEAIDFDPGAGVDSITPTTAGNRSSFILKLDSSANFLWVQTQDAINGEIKTEDATPDAQGNVYAQGTFSHSTNFEHGTSTHILNTIGSGSPYLIKFNAITGAFGWVKETTAASYVENGVYSLNHDFTLIKQNANGDTLWSKLINGTQQMALSQYKITGYYLDAADNLFVAGWVYDTIQFFREGIDTTYLVAEPHGQNVFVTTWHLCSANSSIDTTIAQGSHYVLPSGDTVSAAGVYVNTILSTGNCDNVITTNLSVTTGIQSAIANPQFAIFPNPFSTQLTFKTATNEPTTVSLYNFLGQQVLQQAFTNTTTLSTAQLASGIYFYELRSRKEVMATGKVVKE